MYVQTQGPGVESDAFLSFTLNAEQILNEYLLSGNVFDAKLFTPLWNLGCCFHDHPTDSGYQQLHVLGHVNMFPFKSDCLEV